MITGHAHKLNEHGLLLVEILLAVALMGIISLSILSAFTYGQGSTAVAGDRTQAAEIANEAIEAVHNITQASFSNLSSYANATTYYLDTSSLQWTLATTPTIIGGIYTPTIVFSDGPSSSRQVTVTVSWPQNNGATGSVSATTYLTNWQASATEQINFTTHRPEVAMS